MKQSRRTALAFFAAPLIALLEFAVVSASTRAPGEGPTWMQSFSAWFFVASIQVYVVVLFFGVIVFALLNSMKKESRVSYTISGALAGVVFAGLLSAMASSHSWGKDAILLGVFAMIGASTGFTFSTLHSCENA